jgi:hypothetical protein
MTEKLYDVYLNSKGYRLAEGASSFSSNIATPFSPKTVTGDYSLSDFDLYSIAAQSDFTGGVGQLKLDDTTKYLWGLRVDTRGERATLGVKLDSNQPDSSHDTAKTVGLIDVQSDLNLAIANEPENQTLSWFELDQTIGKIAIPFATPGATPGGGTFAPDDLANLVLWLKADVGVYQDVAGTTPSDSDTDVVKLWQDQSGEGNDFSNASGDCTWEDNEVNSLPAIKGSGTSNGWLGGLAPVTGGTSRTIFFLVKTEGTAATQVFADLGYQNGPWSGEDYAFYEDSDIIVEDGKREFSDDYSNAAYQVVTLRQDGDSTSDMSLWIDGVQSGVDATGARTINTANNNTSATLFCRNSATKALYSEALIVEVVAYDTNLSDSDRENVEVYLSTRVGGAVAGGDTDIERVWMYIRSRNPITSSSTVNYAIYSDDSGEPDSAVANGTVAISEDDVGYYGKWIGYSFATTPSLSGSTSYWLVLDGDSLAAGENVEILTASHGQSATTSYQYYDTGWNTVTGYTALIIAQYVNQHPDTPPVKFVEWDGFVYALAGSRLYKITDVTSIECTQDGSGIKDIGANATDMLIVQKEGDAAAVLLIALGAGTASIFWNGATTWTALSGGDDSDDRDADYYCIHDSLWWRASYNTTDGVFVQGTDDYTDWSTAETAGAKVIIGDSRFRVKALFSWKGNLYAAKQDGLYVITYDDAYPASTASLQANKLLSLDSEIHPNNFNAWAVWQDDLYFSLASGVARYTSSNVVSSVTPDSSLLEQERKRGEFRAFVSTLTFMYAVYESDVGDWSQVMAYNGNWHSIATSDRTGDMMRALYVDSGIYSDLPRIWTNSGLTLTSFIQPTWSSRRWTFAEDTSSSPVSFFDRAAGNWLDEARGRLYTSWIDGNLQNIIKDWVDLDVIVSNIDSDQYFVSVYYRFDEDDSWTSLGDAKTEPVTNLEFSTDTTGRKIQLRFDFFTNESYNTPQLLGYSLRYIPRPDTKQMFNVQVLIADDLELHNRTKETRSVSTLWSDLVAAREADEAVTFIDPLGTSYNVHVNALARQLVRRREVNSTQVGDAYICTLSLNEA